jgi:hypothetical protein
MRPDHSLQTRRASEDARRVFLYNQKIRRVTGA